MNEMTVLDQTGDTKTVWDPSHPEEVEAARKTFNELKRKGYIAYNVTEGGKKGLVINGFDPSVGQMILSPAMAGG